MFLEKASVITYPVPITRLLQTHDLSFLYSEEMCASNPVQCLSQKTEIWYHPQEMLEV